MELHRVFEVGDPVIHRQIQYPRIHRNQFEHVAQESQSLIRHFLPGCLARDVVLLKLMADTKARTDPRSANVQIRLAAA